MRQRNAVVALVVAACLVTAGCAADDEPAIPAGRPSPAPTAEPSPTSERVPTAEPEPSETPAGPPSSTPDDPASQPPTEAAPDGFADPPYRRPLPRPGDPAPTTPSPSPSGPATSAPPSGPSAPPTVPPTPEEVGGPSGVLAFGQTYVWDNGLTITAGRPVELAAQEGLGEDPEASDSAPAPDPAAAADPAAAPAPQPAGEPAADPSAPYAAELAGTEPADATGDGTVAEVRPVSPSPSAAATVVTVDLVIVNGTEKPINTSFFVAMTSGGADAPAVYDPEAGLAGPPGTMLQPGGTARFTMGFEAKDPADLTMEVRPAYHYVSALFVRPVGAQG